MGSRDHKAPVALGIEEPGCGGLPSAGVVVLEHQAPVAPHPGEPGCVELSSAGLGAPMGGAPSVPIGLHCRGGWGSMVEGNDGQLSS